MNTLAQRIKFAKRELTNLKTAHERGSSLLKIYNTFYKFSSFGLPQAFLDLRVTINFSSNFAAYPFAYATGTTYKSTGGVFYSFQTEWVEYVNNGYRLVLHASAMYTETYGLNGFSIYSTAPVSSITCVQE